MNDQAVDVRNLLRRFRVRVAESRWEAEGIRSFELVDPAGGLLPEFTAGAHINVFMPSGRSRQYSIANDPVERRRYVIAVQREAKGRGGSIEMHDIASAGSHIEISGPINNFSLSDAAARHLLIAGGIGITPILAMVRTLERSGKPWKLFYCARTPAKTAFCDILAGPAYRDRVVFCYDDGDPRRGLDVAELLRAESLDGTHVYCCGPVGLMDAVRAAGQSWPAAQLHFEYFAVPPVTSPGAAATGDMAFEIEIASSGQVLDVPADASILSILEANGIAVPSLCTEGICGTCVVGILEGVPDHRDYVLDRDSTHQITVCCSRSRSPRLKLAL